MEDEENLYSYLKSHALTEEALYPNKTIYEKKKVKKWNDISMTYTSRGEIENEVLNESQKIVTKIFPSLQTVRIQIKEYHNNNVKTEEDIEEKANKIINRTSIRQALAYIKDPPKIPKQSVKKEEIENECHLTEENVSHNRIVSKDFNHGKIQTKQEGQLDNNNSFLKEKEIPKTLKRSRTVKTIDYTSNKDKYWYNKENLNKEICPYQELKFSGSSSNFKNTLKYKDDNMNKINIRNDKLKNLNHCESKSKSLSKDGYGCRHTIHQIYESYNNKISDYILKNRHTLRLYGSMKYSDKNPIYFLRERHGKTAEEILNHENILSEIRGGIVDLTPLPSKSRKRMKSQNEKKEFFEGERSAVAMRRFEYTCNYKRGVIRIDNSYINSTCLIQRWWKNLRINIKTKAATFIQKVYRGHFVREKIRGEFYWILKFSKLEFIQKSFTNKYYSLFWKRIIKKINLTKRVYAKPRQINCNKITKTYTPIFIDRMIKKIQRTFKRFMMTKLSKITVRKLSHPFTFFKINKKSIKFYLIIILQRKLRKYLKFIKNSKNTFHSKTIESHSLKISYNFLKMKKLLKIQNAVRNYLKANKTRLKTGIRIMKSFPQNYEKVIKGCLNNIVVKVQRLLLTKVESKIFKILNIPPMIIKKDNYYTKTYCNKKIIKIQKKWKIYRILVTILRIKKLNSNEAKFLTKSNRFEINIFKKLVRKILIAWKKFISNKIITHRPLTKSFSYWTKIFIFAQLNDYVKKIQSVTRKYLRKINELSLPNLNPYQSTKYIRINMSKIIVINKIQKAYKEYRKKFPVYKRMSIIPLNQNKDILIHALSKLIKLQRKFKLLYKIKNCLTKNSKITKYLDLCCFSKSNSFFFKNHTNISVLKINKFLKFSFHNYLKTYDNNLTEKRRKNYILYEDRMPTNIKIKNVILIQNFFKKYISSKKIIYRDKLKISQLFFYTKSYFSQNFHKSINIIKKTYKLAFKKENNFTVLNEKSRFNINKKSFQNGSFKKLYNISKNTFSLLAAKIQKQYRKFFILKNSKTFSIPKCYAQNYTKNITFSLNYKISIIKKILKLFCSLIIKNHYINTPYTIFIERYYVDENFSLPYNSKNILFDSNEVKSPEHVIINKKHISVFNFFSKKIKSNFSQTKVRKIQQHFRSFLSSKIINKKIIKENAVLFTKQNKNLFYNNNWSRISKFLLKNKMKNNKFLSKPKTWLVCFTKQTRFNFLSHLLNLQNYIRNYLRYKKEIFNRERISPIMVDKCYYKLPLKHILNIHKFIRKGLLKNKLNRLDYLIRDIRLNRDRNTMKEILLGMKKLEPKNKTLDENLFTNFNVFKKIDTRHAEKLKKKLKKYTIKNKRESILKSIFEKLSSRKQQIKEDAFKLWKNSRIETMLNISVNSFNEKFSSALDIDEDENHKSLKIRLKLTQKSNQEEEVFDIMNMIGKKPTNNRNKFDVYFQKINEKKENELHNNLSQSFISNSHRNEDECLLHDMKITMPKIEHKQKVNHLNHVMKKSNKSSRTLIRDNNEIDILKYGTNRTKRDLDL